jgi:hypothetical protein
MDIPQMNTLRSSVSIAALLLATNAPISVAAQSAAPDDQSPGSPQRVEQAKAVLPRVGTNQTIIMPTQAKLSLAVQPGLTEGEDWLKILDETLGKATTPSTLAEGAFILSRPGQLIAGPNETMIFVPDQDTRSPGEGPVLLMPCRTLEQLENQWTGQAVEVSGEIFTYHGRNQLLISKYQIITKSTTPITPETEPTSQDSPTHPTEPTTIENDPDVRDLLDELSGDLDSPNRPARRIPQTPDTRTPRQQITANPDQQLPEGTLILRQPARLIRNPDGAWTSVFDHDTPNADDSIELIVEPCRMLMRMERIAMDSGDAGQLLVSGRIYTYKNEHYILPTLIQRVRNNEINSLQ